jgi:hypothetical protein
MTRHLTEVSFAHVEPIIAHRQSNFSRRATIWSLILPMVVLLELIDGGGHTVLRHES